ncbi:MAG: septal ring lytic transglycosylase RlpA family protein [Steroidobacteraceae bacterium]
MSVATRTFLVALALSVAGCASRPPRRIHLTPRYCVAHHGCYRVLLSAAGYRARGMASWYGLKDAGRPTASGVPFDPAAQRVAHKTLPFGTWVTIRNLRNGREAVAMVDDRGPFYGGRILDASPAVAQRLGFYRDGTAPVLVTAVPVAELSGAQRQAARADEQTAVDNARRHPHAILAEAGHVTVRGVVDVTTTGVRVGVDVVRGALDLGVDVLRAL